MWNGVVETYQAGGLWHNHLQGTTPVLSSHATKADAEEAGRRYAVTLQVEHIVRSLTERIITQYSYAAASVPPCAGTAVDSEESDKSV